MICTKLKFKTRFLFPGYINSNLFNIKIDTEVLKTDHAVQFHHFILFNHIFNIQVTSNFGGLGVCVLLRVFLLLFCFWGGFLFFRFLVRFLGFVWGFFWLGGEGLFWFCFLNCRNYQDKT